MADSVSSAQSGQNMFETRLDVSQGLRSQVVRVLNERLADSFDLYSQTKQAHWNVKGHDFYQLHILFDKLAEVVLKHVDLLAERATALGGMAAGTARMAANASTLPELPINNVEGMELVSELADRYAAHAKNLRENANSMEEDLDDPMTQDLLTSMGREIERSLYFLESHLQMDIRAR